MRILRNICIILLLTVIVASCQRRPFSDSTTAVNIRLKVKTEVNHNRAPVTTPETMRIDLFDVNTGAIAYTDFISTEGGYIYPAPGNYDLVVYNIGTESTIVRNEQNKNSLEAYTNEISAYIKSQIGEFLTKRAEARRQMAAEKVDTKDQATKDPVLEGNEKIVNEPDHLFVGKIDKVIIPAFEIGEDKEISIEVEASSIVETWKITVHPVDGLQWVSSISALITGQVESNFFGKSQKSEDVATIFFEMQKNQESRTITGYFNTFGKNPDYTSLLSLDLNIVDNAGDPHHYHFDLTDQFFENEEFYLEVENPIVIEEPDVEGEGGFSTSIGDWIEKETDIEL